MGGTPKSYSLIGFSMKKQFIFEGSPGSPPLESTTRSANLLDHEELMARMASFDLAKHSISGVSSNWITMTNHQPAGLHTLPKSRFGCPKSGRLTNA